MKPSMIRFGGLFIVLLIFVGGSVGAETKVEEPTPTSTPTVTPSPTSTSTPTPTSTPTSTTTPTSTPTASPAPPTLNSPPPYNDWAQEDPDYKVPWTVKCDDDEPLNGYRLSEWALGFCVPGMITRESQFFKMPEQHFGLLSSYADGVMEAQVDHKGYDPETTEGVALMSCSYMHETVYLQTIDGSWYGPFKVVDCSGRNHMYYHMVGMGLAVEVSRKMAEQMGGLVLQRVNVSIGGKSNGPFVWLAGYWVENILSWEGW